MVKSFSALVYSYLYQLMNLTLPRFLTQAQPILITELCLASIILRRKELHTIFILVCSYTALYIVST